MSIAPFPHVYMARLEKESLVAGDRPPIRVGTPPQFGGSADVWSPEQLLVGAALTCLKTTFDAYARSEGITIHEWRGVGTGVLIKGREGPVFELIDLEVDIVTDADDEARARSVLASIERRCIISRALDVPIRVTGRVTSALERAAG